MLTGFVALKFLETDFSFRSAETWIWIWVKEQIRSSPCRHSQLAVIWNSVYWPRETSFSGSPLRRYSGCPSFLPVTARGAAEHGSEACVEITWRNTDVITYRAGKGADGFNVKCCSNNNNNNKKIKIILLLLSLQKVRQKKRSCDVKII